jgi:hypothetical protein
MISSRKHKTIQNDRGYSWKSLLNNTKKQSMIPDIWMLVKSPNGVREIWLHFFVLTISFHPQLSLHSPFSSASIQTKYELPMWNMIWTLVVIIYVRLRYETQDTSIAHARKKAELSSLKPQQRQMSYLCGSKWAWKTIYIYRYPWKIAWGPVLIKEGKTHDFHTYWEVFIVGHGFWNYHACMELLHRKCILGQQFRR